MSDGGLSVTLSVRLLGGAKGDKMPTLIIPRLGHLFWVLPMEPCQD
jgi:hypothetical protein